MPKLITSARGPIALWLGVGAAEPPTVAELQLQLKQAGSKQSAADSGFSKDAEQRKWGAQQLPHPGRLLRSGSHEGHRASARSVRATSTAKGRKARSGKGGGATRG